MYSNVYKFTLCLIIALCGVESFDFVVNNTPPNAHVAFLGMITACLLLIERMYIILWLESKGVKRK